MGKHLQFPLYKLFVVTAVYAIALGLSSRFGGGWQRHCVVLMVGTAINILVLVARAENLNRVLEIGFWVLFCAAGAIYSMIYNPGPLFAMGPQDDTCDNWIAKSALVLAAGAGMSIGAAVGFLFQRLRRSQAIFLDDARRSSDETR